MRAAAPHLLPLLIYLNQPASLSNVPTTVPSAGKLDGYFSSVQAKSGPRHHNIGDTATLSTDIPPSTSAEINNLLPSTTSAGINNLPHVRAGQAPSQRLFSIATGIDPCSLTIQDSDECYLFVDMRAELKWLSYQMTSKCWIFATEEYNLRLVKKKGESVVRKNPQALLRALCNIGPSAELYIRWQKWNLERLSLLPGMEEMDYDLVGDIIRARPSLFHS